MFGKIFLTAAFAVMLPLLTLGQFTLQGKVVDKENGEPLPGAHILLNGRRNVSDKEGKFSFNELDKGSYNLRISYMGYADYLRKIELTGNMNLVVKMQVSATMEDAVVISAFRADENTGTSFSNITKGEIKAADAVQDLPYIIDMTPSVVTSSDAGAGVGYTSLRIRGSDLTRINVTVNGVPLNDPESQGVWFVDLPDFAGSLNSIQIQRGVGTSVNGPAAFGGTIDLQTNGLNAEPEGQVDLSYGSFNTRRYRFSASTGLLKNNTTFDVRMSKLHSDGYIDRAFSDMGSFFVSGAHYGKKSILRMNIFSGKEKTYQAWYGVPKDSLKTNRTMNPYTYNNETDNYIQTHYQLLYSYKINSNWLINGVLHYTKGKGYYENYKKDKKFWSYGLPDFIAGTDTIKRTDLVQQKWLDNDYYAGVFSADYNSKKLKLKIGASATAYDGDHYGQIIWAEYAPMGKDFRWYDNNGFKKDFNAFAKATYFIDNDLSIYGDLQYRYVDYELKGIHDDLHDLGGRYVFNFVNPKAGVVYKITGRQKIYGSFAIANKEPSRNNYRDADKDYTPKPEHLTDYELGYAFNGKKGIIRANLYFMNYKDQLVETGKVNNVGSPIMINVAQSYRAGIELVAGHRFSRHFNWNINATFSQNKILNFTSFVDNWDTWSQDSAQLGTTDISFSPAVILKNALMFRFFDALDIALLTRYVSRQYIDNTSSKERSLDPYLVNDLKLGYDIKVKSLKTFRINISINNIFNEMYETNAWVYRYIYNGKEQEMNGYFPQAGINFTAGLSIGF